MIWSNSSWIVMLNVSSNLHRFEYVRTFSYLSQSRINQRFSLVYFSSLTINSQYSNFYHRWEWMNQIISSTLSSREQRRLLLLMHFVLIRQTHLEVWRSHSRRCCDFVRVLRLVSSFFRILFHILLFRLLWHCKDVSS
jgi:hypothetical protein